MMAHDGGSVVGNFQKPKNTLRGHPSISLFVGHRYARPPQRLMDGWKLSCFAISQTCPALLAPRQTFSFLLVGKKPSRFVRADLHPTVERSIVVAGQFHLRPPLARAPVGQRFLA